MTNYTKQDYERDLQIVAKVPALHLDRYEFYNESSGHLYTLTDESNVVKVFVLSENVDFRTDRKYIDYENSQRLDCLRDKIAMYEANQKLVAEKEWLLRRLIVTHNSLKTYGSHELIDSANEKLFKELTND